MIVGEHLDTYLAKIWMIISVSDNEMNEGCSFETMIDIVRPPSVSPTCRTPNAERPVNSFLPREKRPLIFWPQPNPPLGESVISVSPVMGMLATRTRNSVVKTPIQSISRPHSPKAFFVAVIEKKNDRSLSGPKAISRQRDLIPR